MRARFETRQVAPARVDELIPVDGFGQIGDRPDAQLHGSRLLQISDLLGKDLDGYACTSRGDLEWLSSSDGLSPAMTRPAERSSRSTKSRRIRCRLVLARPHASSGLPKDFLSTTMARKTKACARP